LRKLKPLLQLEAVRVLLEQGIRLKDVTKASGYTHPELSMMLKCWNIVRKPGPKKGWKAVA
jgi:hypothetical protein